MPILQQGNIIVIPVDANSIVFEIQEDKSLKPISATDISTADELVNKTRKSVYRAMTSIRSNIKTAEMAKKMADLSLEFIEDEFQKETIRSLIKRCDTAVVDSHKDISMYEDFMAISLEFMLEHNLIIEQVDSHSGAVDTEEATKYTSDFLAKLQKKS